MATLNPVSQKQCKKCDKCGTLITFATNRNGKKFPVEVFPHPTLGMVYKSGMGAYGNLTPWHKCEEVQSMQKQAEERRQQKERDQLANEIASKYTDRLLQAVKDGDMVTFDALREEYAAELRAAGLI